MTTATNPLEGLQVEEKDQTFKDPGRPSDRRWISDRQFDFIMKLAQEKDVTFLSDDFEAFKESYEDDTLDTYLGSLTGGRGGTASQLIDALLQAPRQGEKLSGNQDIDVDGGGYFGVNEKRYLIDAPSAGKWAGWIFFKTGSDYHDQQRLGMVRPGGRYQGKAADVFAAIVADPQAAREEYARITGRCYVCNRKLEDATSRRLGIGPVCRAG